MRRKGSYSGWEKDLYSGSVSTSNSYTSTGKCKHGVDLYGVNSLPPICRECINEEYDKWLKEYAAKNHMNLALQDEVSWDDLYNAWLAGKGLEL